MSLPTHGRYDYRPITRRARYVWPKGKGLAVYLALNLEHFAFGEGLGAELVPSGHHPDVLNYAWRDYGNRVGAWRLLDLFRALALPCSVLVNSSLYDYCPELIAAFRQRGDEIVAHGHTNSARQSSLDAESERLLIRETTDAIARHEGKPPRGWLGPWIAESLATPDLLADAGYAYLLDWCHDDQPTWLRTRGGRILSVPYPQELNDIPAIVVRRQSAETFADMIVANFDEMREQAREQPLIMGIALHPYIVGQPFRLRALRRALEHIVRAGDDVWCCRAGEIAAHVSALPDGTVP